MKLLVLGGTKNLGRHVVEAALRDDHEVTLFNRGVTNPGLFPSVRRLTGERADPGVLAAGEWDGVIDMSGFLVRDVRLSAEVLRDRVGHYTYMSSIAVYASKTTLGMTESAPLLPWPAGAPEDHFTMDLYGPSKVRCESLLSATFGDRTAAVRSGFVVGPYNPDFGNWGWALAHDTPMECAARPDPTHPVRRRPRPGRLPSPPHRQRSPRPFQRRRPHPHDGGPGRLLALRRTRPAADELVPHR